MPRLSLRPSRAALPLTLVAGLALALAASLTPARAQQSGYGQTMGSSPMENEIYNYDPGNGNRPGGAGSGLNPANPLDLINKIRKGSAMDNATPPGDAVDQALKELEAQSRPASAASTGSLVTAPRPSGAAGATP